MDNKIVVTYIYSDTIQTRKTLGSITRLNLPYYNMFVERKRYMGNGFALQDFYKALNQLKDKYEYAVYTDGGDTFFANDFRPDQNRLIYSTERACYPHPSLAAEYPAPRQQGNPYRFLNGGNWVAPIPIMLEFMERYGLNKYTKDINGQHELMVAYLQAIKEGFPMQLDEECQYFQTIAFADPGDLIITEQGIKNNITNTYPHIFHGNGRTDMDWIYDYYEKRT